MPYFPEFLKSRAQERFIVKMKLFARKRMSTFLIFENSQIKTEKSAKYDLKKLFQLEEQQLELLLDLIVLSLKLQRLLP